MGVVLLLLQKNDSVVLEGDPASRPLCAPQTSESRGRESLCWLWWLSLMPGAHWTTLPTATCTKEVCVWNAEVPEGVLLRPMSKVHENSNSLT